LDRLLAEETSECELVESIDDKDRKIYELKHKIQEYKAHMTRIHRSNSSSRKLREKEKAKNRKKKVIG
jgi:hypothetical protein